jgi:hypothetical protein
MRYFSDSNIEEVNSFLNGANTFIVKTVNTQRVLVSKVVYTQIDIFP